MQVEADTPEEAEVKAAAIPRVISVFGKSAVRGDYVVNDPLQGVQDE